MAGGFLADRRVHVAQVWGTWVDPAARGRGIGRQLVEAISEWARTAGARSLRLAVTDCTEAQPAVRLYRGLGFEPTGDAEPLGWNPELSALFMQREL